MSDAGQKLTFAIVVTSKPARASTPRTSDISWISRFVSCALLELDLSWEIFARKQGCCERWTLLGRDDIANRQSKDSDLKEE